MSTGPFEIVIENGPDAGKRFPLVKPETVIGRDPTCEIPLADEFASRRHAKVVLDPGGPLLVNMSSVGTALGGQPVDRHQLTEGDVFEIGPYSKLRFRTVGAAKAPAIDMATRAVRPIDTARLAAARAAGAAVTATMAPVSPAPVYAVAAAPAPVPAPPVPPAAALPPAGSTGLAPPAPPAGSTKRTKLFVGIGAYMLALVGLFILLSGIKKRGGVPPAPPLSTEDILRHLKTAPVPLPANADEAAEWRNEAMTKFEVRRPEYLYQIYAKLRGTAKFERNSDEPALPDEFETFDKARSQLVDILYREYHRAYLLDRAGQHDAALRQYRRLRKIIPNHRLEIYQIAVERERILSDLAG